MYRDIKIRFEKNVQKRTNERKVLSFCLNHCRISLFELVPSWLGNIFNLFPSFITLIDRTAEEAIDGLSGGIYPALEKRERICMMSDGHGEGE